MTTPKPTPASDDQVESLKLGLEKTVAYTLSGFAAHATMSILVARIEADREQIRAGNSAFVEMNAVFEAVMRAIRGESLSEFDESHGSVYEAKMLHDSLRAKDEEIARLRDALTTLENRLFGLAELTPICQLHRHGLSAMVDFIRAVLSKPEPGR